MHITWIGSLPLESLDRCISSVFCICRKHFKRCVLLKSVFTSACSLSQGLDCVALLPEPSEHWDYRCALPHQAGLSFLVGCSCGVWLLSIISVLLLSLPSSVSPFIFVFIYPVLLRGSRGRFVSFRVSGFASQCWSK